MQLLALYKVTADAKSGDAILTKTLKRASQCIINNARIKTNPIDFKTPIFKCQDEKFENINIIIAGVKKIPAVTAAGISVGKF